MRITERRLREVIRQVLRENMNESDVNIKSRPEQFRELGYRQVNVIKPRKDLKDNQVREKIGYMIVKKNDSEEHHVLEGDGHYLKNLRYCCGPFESLKVAKSNVPFDNDIHYDLDSRF